MNPVEAAAFYGAQTLLISGSIVVLLILGAFLWWENYRAARRKPPAHQLPPGTAPAPVKRTKRRKRSPAAKRKS